MNTDTDPTELTPPDGQMHFSLPPNASREQIIDRFNRLLGVLYHVTGEVTELHQVVSGGQAPCPLPADACAALNMAETASIGVAELHGMRNKDARTIMVVTGAAALLASIIGVLGAAALTRQAEAAVERKTPEIVEISMAKYQKSTEAIAFESARSGAEFALQQFTKNQQVPPLTSKPDKLH